MTILEKLFGNAFSTPQSADLTPAEREAERALFERVADAIVSRGLTTPAILFLEMHQPLSYVAGQLAHGLGPFASIVVEQKDIDIFAASLCRRDGIENLVRTIERKDREAARTTDPGEREV